MLTGIFFLCWVPGGTRADFLIKIDYLTISYIVDTQ